MTGKDTLHRRSGGEVLPGAPTPVATAIRDAEGASSSFPPGATRWRLAYLFPPTPPCAIRPVGRTGGVTSQSDRGDFVAGITVDCAREPASLLGRRDRGKMLDLRGDGRAAQVGSDIAISPGGRDCVAEHPTEHTAHPARTFISAGRLHLAQDGQDFLRRYFRNGKAAK